MIYVIMIVLFLYLQYQHNKFVKETNAGTKAISSCLHAAEKRIKFAEEENYRLEKEIEKLNPAKPKKTK